MDTVFYLGVEARSLFLRTIAQNTGCSYICLWSFAPLVPDRLFSIDGWYNEDASSSSTISLPQRLFNAYRQTQHTMDTNSLFVPGAAFKESIPYLELTELELLQRTSNNIQLQFYQEARIKAVAFFSCRSGEIEIGMKTTNTANMKQEMNNWFQMSQYEYQERHSSSSSSLRSLSVGSPESSPLLFSLPSSSTTYIPETLTRPTSTLSFPQQHTMEAYNNLRIQSLYPQSDNAEITKAMLAVISSPSSPSSSYSQAKQNRIHTQKRGGAFKDYTSTLALNSQRTAISGRQNMLKRSISLLRSIHLNYRDEMMTRVTQPTNAQLHHKMSERKRREKLNESFEELRLLLPPGSKKDKASVLSNTLEYLTNLKTEVVELKQKNQVLEERSPNTKRIITEELPNEKTSVRIIHSAASTSNEKEIDLQVTVRGECNIIDLVIDMLEYVKLVKEASIAHMNAETDQTNAINKIIFTMKIKGSEWDEAAFVEAMTKIVEDVTS